MAESIVSFAVEAIGNLLIEEAKFLHGVSDQVMQLQLELRRMLSFLRDADARQHDEEIIKEWISQARDLAYEADDLIERYAFKVESTRRKDIRRIIKRCACILSECYTTHTTGEGIQTLKTKISDLTKSLQEYGIARVIMQEKENESGLSEKELRRTYSSAVEDHFVGLGGNVELLVENLFAEHFRVVSIFGMGGLGKSTLARKVYHHSKVKRYFDDRVWICISQKWKKEDILKQILIKLMPEKREDILKWIDSELIRQLSQIQQNKQYLIVLDDIWSVNAWESIKQAFPIRKDGSKILLTTRRKDVALQIDPNGFHYEPRLLSNDESWELLQMKAPRERREEDSEQTKKFETLGKEMAKACGGLPLGVIVLGGVLATKKSLNEWEEVYKNIKVHLERGNNLLQEQGDVSKILALSYNDLPAKLKPCFLYLTKFEEDSDIDVETLYQLWIAEGLISVKDRFGDRETMMDVAERYLGELVQRCIVQGKSLKKPSLLKCFESCRLHDLMRDLCVLKAKEENFLLSVSNDDIADSSTCSSLTDLLQVYRLSIRFSGDESNTSKIFPLKISKTKHLRSLALMFSNRRYTGRMVKAMNSQINEFKMLRVLAIEELPPFRGNSFRDALNLGMDHWRLPKAVSKLIHLRYLSLRGSFLLCLPSSIGNLKHLQTLDLRDTELLRIPDVLWRLRQLRHLYLPKVQYWRLIDEHCKLTWFRKLRLNGLDKLEILELFSISIFHTKDISNLLNNLRSFSAIIDMDSGEDPTELIGILMSSNSKRLLRQASLQINCHEPSAATTLYNVVCQCFAGCNFQLDLAVNGPINKLPKYESHCFCSGLTHLALSESGLTEDPMGTLEMLPDLSSLVLWDCFKGKEMRCTASGFRRLSFLYLAHLHILEKWWIDEGAMPNLSTLQITHCTSLEMIPIGLKFITTLQELKIYRMPKEFTDRIQVVDGREGEDLDKISHISSIIVRD